LSVPNITLAVARQAGSGGGGSAGPFEPDLSLPAGNIVSDGFESGDLSAAGYPDFDWTEMRFTSLVTMSPSGNPTVIYNGSSIYNELVGDPRDWTALNGENSMRFAFNEGTDTNVFAEQRWRLVGRSEKTLWMRFAMRVPLNYIHENVPDIYGESYSPTPNNKLFFIWMDSYTGTGAKVGMEFRPDGAGGSNFYLKTIGVGNGGDRGSVPFITYPDDQGRHMYLAVKVVTESTPGASDGSVEVWRKWAESGSVWQKTHELLGEPFNLPTDGSFPGWSFGYLMGADNSGYAEQTEFLIDDFNLSTASLL
jgi:hypothetical protein